MSSAHQNCVARRGFLISRAWHKDGHITSIDSVQSGANCNCFCIDCGTPLIAAKGPQNRHHFKHSPSYERSNDCGWAPESELHLKAKEVIEKHKQIKAPLGTLGKERFCLVFDSVKLETPDPGICRIPDITAMKDGEVFNIEIAVTHRCDKGKIDDLKRNGKNCIEIDLGEYWSSIKKTDFIDDNSVLEAIARAETKWLSVAPSGVIAGKIHEHNKHQLRSQHLELKELNEKIGNVTTLIRIKENHLRTVESRLDSAESLESEISSLIKESEELDWQIEQKKTEIHNLKNFDYEAELERRSAAINDQWQKLYEQQQLTDEYRLNLENKAAEFSRHINNVEHDLSIREQSLLAQQSEFTRRKKEYELEQREIKQQQASNATSIENYIESEVTKRTDCRVNQVLKQKRDEIALLDKEVARARKAYEAVKKECGALVRIKPI